MCVCCIFYLYIISYISCVCLSFSICFFHNQPSSVEAAGEEWRKEGRDWWREKDRQLRAMLAERIPVMQVEAPKRGGFKL